VAVNGERLGPADLLAKLNTIGGRHGVGRLDLVENRYVGMKSRGVYETPGGTLMLAAHRAVESLTLDREVTHIRDGLVPRYAEMVYYGYWFTPERRMLQTAIDESQRTVDGTARLKLYKGGVTVVGRRAEPSTTQHRELEAGASQPGRRRGLHPLSALRLRIQALVASAAQG
jgi:argininosuccinate synthase